MRIWTWQILRAILLIPVFLMLTIPLCLPRTYHPTGVNTPPLNLKDSQVSAPSWLLQDVLQVSLLRHVTAATLCSPGGPGQVLIKVIWISLVPAMQSWLNNSK